jgi:hypothetical protein
MAIEVIGAGLGRTGTYSLKAALEELGFAQCYHMAELLGHPEHVTYWEDASAGKPVDWDALFEGYRAAVDYPACSYYQRLMEQYPDAKMILTVRAPDSWYESAAATIFKVGQRQPEASGAPPVLPFPGDPQLLMRVFGLSRRDVWERDFEGRFEDREFAIRRFNEHTHTVKAHVPPDRLLVYEVKEGWEPLCRFLGVAVPEGKPFPRLNDRATFQSRLKGPQDDAGTSAGE